MEEIMADKKPSVVMFSGGIDSTAVLKRLLVETDKNIYAHHIHMNQGDRFNRKSGEHNRYKAEAEAVNQIIPYMKRTYRDFNFTESTIDTSEISSLLIKNPSLRKKIRGLGLPVSGLPTVLWDIGTYTYMASILANYIDAIEIYSGTRELFITNNNHESRHTPESAEQHEVLERSHNMAFWMWYPHKPIEIALFDKPKIECIQYLEKELLDMAWGCRQPQGESAPYTVCNQCSTCVQINKILLEISETS